MTTSTNGVGGDAAPHTTGMDSPRTDGTFPVLIQKSHVVPNSHQQSFTQVGRARASGSSLS